MSCSRNHVPLPAAAFDAMHLACGLVLCGLAVVLCLPAARGSNAGVGWWPLWLVLMPSASVALLALRRWQVDAAPSRPVRAGGRRAAPRQARRLRRSGGRLPQAGQARNAAGSA